jgi:hypothetical protein
VTVEQGTAAQALTVMNLNVSFPSTPDVLFTSANITISSEVGSIPRARATVSTTAVITPHNAAAAVPRIVSLDQKGGLVSDQTLLSGFLNSLATSEVIDAVEESLYQVSYFMPLRGVGLDPGRVGRSSYVMLVRSLAGLPALPDISSQLAAAILETAFEQAVDTPGFIARATFTPNALDLDLNYAGLHGVALTDPSLLGQVDAREWTLPTIVRSRLQIVLRPQGAEPAVNFTLRAAGELRGFTPGVRLRMNSVVASRASFVLAADLPANASSFFRFELEGSSLLREPVRLVLENKKLGDGDTMPELTIEGLELTGADPRSLFEDLSGILSVPSEALRGALRLPFAPWDKSVGEYTKFALDIADQLSWLLAPASTDPTNAPVLSLSKEICASAPPGTFEANFTINGGDPVTCNLNITSTGNFTKAAEELNAALDRCNLDIFLQAAVFDDGLECGQLALLPALPGIVREFTVSSSVFFSSWALPLVPEFGSFLDLVPILRALWPDMAARLPDLRFLQAQPEDLPGVIHPDLQQAYSNFTVAAFSLALDHVTNGPATAGGNFSLLDTHSQVSLGAGIQATASIAVTFSADLLLVVGLPIQTVCVQTNFSGDGNETQRLVPAEANEVHLAVKALRRNGLRVERVEWSGALQLSPGMPMAEALAEAVRTQPVGTWLAGLLHSSIRLADPLYGFSDQAEICLNATVLPDGTWLVPYSISVTDDASPFFGRQRITPPNFEMVARPRFNVSASIDVGQQRRRADGSAIGAGILGAVEFLASSISGSGSLQLSVGPKNSNLFKTVGELVSAMLHGEGFFGLFRLDAGVNASWNLDQISLSLDNFGLPRGGLSATAAVHQVVETPEQLPQLMDGMQFNASFSDETLRALSRLVPTSFCDGLKAFLDLSEAASVSPLLEKHLPFLKKAAKEGASLREVVYSSPPFPAISFTNVVVVWDSGAGGLLRLAVEGICDKKSQAFAAFCNTSRQKLGYDLCGVAEITEQRLLLPLIWQPRGINEMAEFRFDPLELLGGELPVASGLEGSFDLRIDAIARAVLVVEFDQKKRASGDLRFSLGPGTGINVTLASNFQGDISLRFGAARITFGGALGEIHLRVGLDVSPGLDFDLKLEGMAKLSAGLQFAGEDLCDFALDIPDMRAFLEGRTTGRLLSSNCPGGPLAALAELLQRLSDTSFWADTGLIEHAFTEGLEALLGNVWTRRLARLNFPLLPKLAEFLAVPVKAILKGENLNNLTAGWSAMMVDIQKQLGLADEHAEQFILQQFTELICSLFRQNLRECPPVPSIDDAEKTWRLPFFGLKDIPVNKAGFNLGKHGRANLEFECTLLLRLRYEFTFTLAASRQLGFRLLFEDEPILRARAELLLDPGCRLSGYLIVMGFEFRPNGMFIAELEVGQGWRVETGVYAILQGQVDLGFAGPLVRKLAHENDSEAIRALPHLRAQLTLGWSWNMGRPDSTPDVFLFNDTILCLGSYFTAIVGDLNRQVHKIIRPLEPVLGPDGLLLKKIEVSKYLIGRETNLLEVMHFIYKTFCSGTCRWEGVFEAVALAAEVYQMVDAFTQMTLADPDGCGVVQSVRNFLLDFNRQNLEPEWTTPPPDAELLFSPAMQPHEATFRKYFTRSVEGRFAFKVDILEKPIEKLIAILLGKRVPIAGFAIPRLSLALGAQFSFPVWPVRSYFFFSLFSLSLSLYIYI